MSQIAVPVERPAVADEPDYIGRHRQPETEPGESTVEVRPRNLAEDNGPTRKLNVMSSFATAARAVFGTGVR